MEYRNYNIHALNGDTETSDMDVCEALGLDPSLAGTPAINEAAIKAMHRNNYDGFTKKGYTPKEALSKADSLADTVRENVKTLMKA